MKITLEFTDEEERAIESYRGPRAHAVLRRFDEWLRGELKHGTLDRRERAVLEAARARLVCLTEEHEVRLF